jgi:hypothetical protein
MNRAISCSTLLRQGVVVAAVVLGSLVLAGPAVADLPDAGSSAGPCAGKGMSHVVRRYRPVAWGDGSAPLRCGLWIPATHRGWGYPKLVANGRWNVWWDGMIGATLEAPVSVKHDGTSTTFKTKWFTNCSPVYRFVVVVESRPTPQGVVTGVNNAYQKFQTN